LEHSFIVTLLCITELMVPGLGAVCGVTDGSEANSAACTCGSEECTSTTGLICYSTYGGGSCRKTGFGPFGYAKEAGDTNCESVSNRKPILDKAMCEAAATSMGLDDVVAYEDSEGRDPPGCFWFSGSLRYNTMSTSTASCTHNSNFCLCIAASDCTHTNGATSNTDVCLCGGIGCTAISGLYCTSSTSTCSSGNPCTSVDGSSLNTIDCSCGTAACNSFNGMFCDSSLSQCATAPITACVKTDGSAASSVTCVCGNVACTVSTGLICYSTYGGGSCRKTGLGPFGYIKEEGDKMCVDVSNRKPILDKAACEAAATSMGLDVVVAEDTSSHYDNEFYPPGCWYGSGGSGGVGLKYNSLSTSTRSCTVISPDNFCLCIARSSASDWCDNIDGSGTDFASSSCDAGTNHLKDNLMSVPCATDTCAASDCCDANPTCDDIDGSGADFSSCVAGTNHLKDVLTGTCATDTCAVSDCCKAVAEESGPSPVAEDSGPSPVAVAEESGPSPVSKSGTVVDGDQESDSSITSINMIFAFLVTIIFTISQHTY